MKRILIIDNEKLKDMELKKLIVDICPMNRAGKECMKIEADGRLTADESLVTEGCKICCKQDPDALKMVRLPEELTSQPIHRYGENQFVLYSLPIPIFGKVVGIVGVNAIGKSTAIKVLAGVLKPNLGDWKQKKEASYDDIIEYFKGTEAQIFFEKVKKGEITISYKPQQVELIPKTTKGKVRTLLKKVDEKGAFESIVKELDLEPILDNDITAISGGELQRVAIAATVLKKANFYVFDEPTSYLDIKQRLKISTFIRKLATDDTAVMVVEHDLIILDALTDLVHVMYGQEGAYGIVSLPRTARVGINAYLDGFLKEENMRFRDHKIKFEKRPPIKGRQEPVITSWKDIKKKVGKFHITALSGEIQKHDVIGILGENGIGKTTFVKILAGVDKQDTGEIDKQVKVAYKSQYLHSESDELVVTYVHDAIAKYNNQLVDPLKLKPLFDKKLNQLSGGELQRVEIARCLSQDVDLFLLDEPSAYLDVEQRLLIAKIIREIMKQRGTTSLAVDHDLLFLDYLSKKLMVFEGIPAKEGQALGPFAMEEGMTHFLKNIGQTFRRDEESNRPRANKEGSVKDREQKKQGKYYYA